MCDKMIYTVNIGNYDIIHNIPEEFKDGWDAYLFTDSNLSDKYNGWNVIKIDKSKFSNLPDVAISRYIKIMEGYPWINNYDYTLYIDGNRVVKKDLNGFFDKFSYSSFLMGESRDPRFEDIYKEMEHCKTRRRCYLKNKDKLLDKQIEAYKQEGISRFAGQLLEGGIIFRKNIIDNKIINSLWWAEFYRWKTWRDQFPLRYLQDKHDLKFDLVPRFILYTNNSLYKDQFFSMVNHRNENCKEKR